MSEIFTTRIPVALLVASGDACRIYSAHLSGVGFEVRMADSKGDAFRAALEHRPDLIITDVRLPRGVGGIPLLVKLRLDMRTTTIPIVVVTDEAIHTDDGRTLAAGCNLYLTKPFEPELLAGYARTLLAA